MILKQCLDPHLCQHAVPVGHMRYPNPWSASCTRKEIWYCMCLHLHTLNDATTEVLWGALASKCWATVWPVRLLPPWACQENRPALGWQVLPVALRIRVQSVRDCSLGLGHAIWRHQGPSNGRSDGTSTGSMIFLLKKCVKISITGLSIQDGGTCT